MIRTRRILEVAGDKKYHKRILQGINKGESRDFLAKELRCSRGGVISQKDAEIQVRVATSMNLVILGMATWNTMHMQRAIRPLMQTGHHIDQEDLRFLTPFARAHMTRIASFFWVFFRTGFVVC
ncbi:MAG: Tn3 family transposase [Desulfobacterales bacterium]|nr:MAG: Tn3 family transposase [Desulfobacterales bacterium]